MISIGLKLSSADSQVDFDVIDVIPDYEVEDERYTALDFERKRLIYAKWQKWTINFGYLDETAQDYLADYASQTAPQFIHSATTYDVEVVKINAKATGGTMEIINTVAE